MKFIHTHKGNYQSMSWSPLRANIIGHMAPAIPFAPAADIMAISAQRSRED
jgi:hypothetical protein